THCLLIQFDHDAAREHSLFNQELLDGTGKFDLELPAVSGDDRFLHARLALTAYGAAPRHGNLKRVISSPGKPDAPPHPTFFSNRFEIGTAPRFNQEHAEASFASVQV